MCATGVVQNEYPFVDDKDQLGVSAPGNAAVGKEPCSPKDDVSMIDLTRLESSKELFSSMSATSCDSVVAIGSDPTSPTTIHASSHTNSSVNQSLTTLQDKSSQNSFSTLSSKHQSTDIDDSVIVINGRIRTNLSAMQSRSSSESTDSSCTLSGSSSDDIEFLSNSKYWDKKRKHAKRDTTFTGVRHKGTSKFQLKGKHRKCKHKLRRHKPIRKMIKIHSRNR